MLFLDGTGVRKIGSILALLTLLLALVFSETTYATPLALAAADASAVGTHVSSNEQTRAATGPAADVTPNLVYNVVFDHASPNILPLNQRVNFTFAYKTNRARSAQDLAAAYDERRTDARRRLLRIAVLPGRRRQRQRLLHRHIRYSGGRQGSRGDVEPRTRQCCYFEQICQFITTSGRRPILSATLV